MSTIRPSFAKLAIAWIFIGAACGWALSHGPVVTFGAFSLSAVNLAMILLPALYLLQTKGNHWSWIWYFTGALALSGSVCHAVELAGLKVDGCALYGLALVGIWAILLYLSLLYKDHENTPGLPGNKVEMAAIISLSAFVVIFYRVSHSLKIDIPNEERSLFVGGVEVHHINVGVIAILAAIILPPTWRWLRILVLAYGAGSIIDQSGYYLLSEVTDASYSYPLAWAGAAISFAVFALLALVLFFRIEQPDRE